MSQPTIYIAGSSREIPRVREAMRAVAQVGYRVAHDWTLPIEKRSARGLVDADMTVTQRAAVASDDCRAIRRAQFFWLLAPETESTGAWWELGYAAGVGKNPVVSGPRGGRCIFVALELSFATDAAALDWLMWRAARGEDAHG